MDMKISALCLRLIMLSLACACPVSAEAIEKPNVIFVLVDDLGWYDVGYNGSSFYETPRLDGLAREWMRFACSTVAMIS